MITINITDGKGKPYWTEYFQTRPEAARWLNTEQSRPYWQKDFSVEILDDTEEREKAQAEYESAQKQKRDEARALIKAFKDKPSKTIADVVKVLQLVLQKLDLDDDSAQVR